MDNFFMDTISLSLPVNNQNFPNSIKPCTNCGSENSRKKCGVCGTLYCSRQCQVHDWNVNNHKSICVPASQPEHQDSDEAAPLYKTAHELGIDRHKAWWYPQRCEYEGCDVQQGLTTCDQCGMVQYCSEQHREQDLDQHGNHCNVFRDLGIRAKFYTDEEMLRRFPIKHTEEKLGKKCRICGVRKTKQGSRSNSTRRDLMLSRCCGLTVCDTEDEYVLFSYSRDICPRSHDRYTLCGYHGVEDYCEKSKDWRECKGCLRYLMEEGQDKSQHYIADTLWRGLNAYNFYPLLSKNVPRHALCDTCGMCGRTFMTAMEGYSMRTIQGRYECVCQGCSGMGY
eukprot:TRINITY_DN6075_c0_g1_i9.p3 TRINITY_DN6075_c0_g1~~TRINITY_DN6075_c0_g1_i9.p3  ORF type:complete len:338 (+),score=11.11 TRINITY_DN6075_c0_g1_i9:22-1035(+)